MNLSFHQSNGAETALAPIVTVGGAFTGPECAWIYAGLHLDDATSNLPMIDKCVFPEKRALAEKDELFGKAESELLDISDQLEMPFVIAGHSIGAYIAEKFTIRHPELVGGVIDIAGAQRGVFEETIAMKALKHAITILSVPLRQPSQFEHIRHDSPHMLDHKNDVASNWPEGVPLYIVGVKNDILIPMPHGLDHKLPEGQIAAAFAVGYNQQQLASMEGVPDHTVGLPDRLSMLFPLLFPRIPLLEHAVAPLQPEVIRLTRNIRRQAALGPQTIEPPRVRQPVAVPIAA